MVTVGEEPPHYIDQLTWDFKFPQAEDRLITKWAEMSSKVGELRIAKLDTRDGATAIAAYVQDNPVAYLSFHDAREDACATLPYLAVGKSSVVPTHRRLGIMPAMISTWIERSGEPLLSDNRQSKEAYYMWIPMACGAEADLEISLWHEDGSTRLFECTNDGISPDPAAGGDKTRWLACAHQTER